MSTTVKIIATFGLAPLTLGFIGVFLHSVYELVTQPVSRINDDVCAGIFFAPVLGAVGAVGITLVWVF